MPGAWPTWAARRWRTGSNVSPRERVGPSGGLLRAQTGTSLGGVPPPTGAGSAFSSGGVSVLPNLRSRFSSCFFFFARSFCRFSY